MNDVYLLTGGNIGDRLRYLSEAAKAIEQNFGTIIKKSLVYETAAWGKEDQPAFLNQVLQLQTNLPAGKLLSAILSIEKTLGRKREMKYGARQIDIDILFFNDDVIDTNGLTIPHPQMQNRRFVLVPLAEINPQKIHPVFHKSIIQLLAECSDTLAVKKFS